MSDSSGNDGASRRGAAVQAALGGFVPSAEQWRAITAENGPVLVEGGAGTGKSGVLMARVVWLLGHEGDARRVLCLTGSTRSALHLRRRLAGVLSCERSRDVPQEGADLLASGGGVPVDGVGKPQRGRRDAPVFTAAFDAQSLDRVRVETYHAFGAAILRRYSARLGLMPETQMLSEGAQLRLCLDVLSEVAFTAFAVRSAQRTAAQALELAQECADHFVSPEDIQAHARALCERRGVPGWIVRQATERAELAEVVARYTARKRAAGWHDRGDQIVRAVELLEAHPEIAERVHKRYRAVVVDEYQDVTAAQARLLGALCPPGSSVMAVGDEQLAINGFRGATTRSLRAFREAFGRPFPPTGLAPKGALARVPAGTASPHGEHLTRVVLSHRYRSGSSILAVADALAGRAPRQADRGPRGHGPQDIAPPQGLVNSGRVSRGTVRAALLADEDEEAAFVARELLDARRSAQQAGTLLGWSDMAVIARSRRMLQPVRAALAACNVPTQGAVHGDVLRAPEVVDLVCLLRALVRPTDNVAFVRVAMGPRWRIGYGHIARLSQWAASRTRALRAQLPGEDPDAGELRYGLVEALDELQEVAGLDDEARARLVALREHLGDLRSLLGRPILEFVHEVAERSGLSEELAVSAPALDQRVGDGGEAFSQRGGHWSTRAFDAFFEYVRTAVPPEEPDSPQALLSSLDASAEAGERVELPVSTEADAVQLLTAHAAKGLEFHTVAVVGLAGGGVDGLADDGVFPRVRPRPIGVSALPAALRDDRDQLSLSTHWPTLRKQLRQMALEDERRVAGVAVTRARERLVLSAAWWYRGAQETAQGPSLFWREAVAALDEDGARVTQMVTQVARPEVSPLEPVGDQGHRWPPPDGVALLSGLDVTESAAVAEARARHGSPPPILADADVGRWERACGVLRQQSQSGAAGSASGASPRAPETNPLDVVGLSVSSLVEYARCPLAFYWSVVEGVPELTLPRRREGDGRAAREGGLSLHDAQARDVVAAGAAVWEDEDLRARRLRASMEREQRHGLGPAERDVGFLLRRGRFAIRGHIDALYRNARHVEVVGWKFGSSSAPVLGGVDDRLAVAALALRDLGALPDGWCRVTSCFLGRNGDSHEHSRLLDAAALAAHDALVGSALTGLAAGRMEPCGRPECGACRQGLPRPADGRFFAHASPAPVSRPRP